MVFPPLDPAIKEKVISAYLSGHRRNQIVREFYEQGAPGSVSNITPAVVYLEMSSKVQFCEISLLSQLYNREWHRTTLLLDVTFICRRCNANLFSSKDLKFPNASS